MSTLQNLWVYKWVRKVYNKIRLTANYKILLTANKEKGVKYTVNDFTFRMPVSWYKYFQSGHYPRVYEPENFEFFKQSIKEGMTCIDIGALIGLYAVFMSKHCHARVFSFEPTPTSQQVFRDMVVVNKCQDLVTLVPAAVSDRSGKTTFYITDRPLWVGNSLYTNNIADPSMQGYEVDVYSIDDFVTKNNIVPDFIKIDAEGSEMDVLNGAENTMLKYKPSGILGIHPNTFMDKKHTYTKIFDALERFGLDIMYDNKTLSRERWMTELMEKTSPFDLQFRNRTTG